MEESTALSPSINHASAMADLTSLCELDQCRAADIYSHYARLEHLYMACSRSYVLPFDAILKCMIVKIKICMSRRYLTKGS